VHACAAVQNDIDDAHSNDLGYLGRALLGLLPLGAWHWVMAS